MVFSPRDKSLVLDNVTDYLSLASVMNIHAVGKISWNIQENIGEREQRIEGH